MAESYAFKQQTEGEFEEPCGPFAMHLLFADKPDESAFEGLEQVLAERLGRVERDGPAFWFADAPADFDGKELPCGLVLCAPEAFDPSLIGDLAMSQMRHAEEYKDELLSAAKWAAAARDLHAEGLSSQDRAFFDVHLLKALMLACRGCLGVYIESCGRLLRPQDVLEVEEEGPAAFVKCAVNARFFAVEGTEDSVVDTVGMNVLGLPDVQYHFHDLDPKSAASHALGLAHFILQNDCPIEDGDAVAGFDESGALSEDVQWTLQYEESLIQPRRSVVDVRCGDYAAGTRE